MRVRTLITKKSIKLRRCRHLTASKQTFQTLFVGLLVYLIVLVSSLHTLQAMWYTTTYQQSTNKNERATTTTNRIR